MRLLFSVFIVVFGLVAVFLLGNVEYSFFLGLSRKFAENALIIVCLIEGFKCVTIFFYEYSKRGGEIKPFSETTNFTLWALRLAMFIGSTVFCILTIYQFMDNPNYKTVYAERERKIIEQYKEKYQHEEEFLNKTIELERSQMNYQMNNVVNGEWHGSRYDSSRANLNSSIQRRERQLNNILRQSDSAIEQLKISLQNDISTQSEILQAAYNALERAGYDVNPNTFTNKCILWIGILLTIIFELCIWSAFSVLGSIAADTR